MCSFLQIAAEGHDIGYALHLAQHAHDVPLHFGAQLVEIVAIAHQAELVHLAQRRRLGRKLGRHPWRKIGGSHPLRDDRSRPETAGIVGKGHGDQRQAEQALATHERHPRRAVQFPLQRHRDAALDLFRRIAGKLGDDRDLGVGDVRIGFDGRVQIGTQPEGGGDQDGKQHRHAAVNAGLD